MIEQMLDPLDVLNNTTLLHAKKIKSVLINGSKKEYHQIIIDFFDQVLSLYNSWVSLNDQFTEMNRRLCTVPNTTLPDLPESLYDTNNFEDLLIYHADDDMVKNTLLDISDCAPKKDVELMIRNMKKDDQSYIDLCSIVTNNMINTNQPAMTKKKLQEELFEFIEQKPSIRSSIPQRIIHKIQRYNQIHHRE